MPAVATQRGLTAEEFWQQYAGKPYELVRGEVKQRMPAGLIHGLIAMRMGRRIDAVASASKRGITVAAETGFRVRTALGESVRAPDVAFIRAERLPSPLPHTFADLAPDLVVEIASPNDAYSDLRDKVDEWLQAGVQVVWVVDPQRRVVEVYQPNQPIRVLREGDTLTGDPVLPDFQLPLSELFAELGEE
jgi:Uma2 family endonuclease